jgi:outer membrane murein-binding lipoprotein Lpp
MSSLRKSLAAATVLGGLSLSGCATTEYVDEQIALVNGRVSALESTVQQVDGKATAAMTEAQSASGAAANANQRLDALTGRVDGIEQRLASPRRPRN